MYKKNLPTKRVLAKKRDQQLSSSEYNPSFGQGSRIVNVEKIKEYTDKWPSMPKTVMVPLCYVVRAGIVWRPSLQGSVPLVSTLLHWRLLRK